MQTDPPAPGDAEAPRTGGPRTGDATALARAKAHWRSRILLARRTRPGIEIGAARQQTTAHLTRALADAGAHTVCLYLPLRTEPLSPDLAAHLLRAGVRRVLAPVAQPGEPLNWCAVTGHLHTDGHRPADPPPVAGMLGVPEPDGPLLGPTVIRTADAIVIPALAVDASGTRLGRGGGHYDRSLALLQPTDRPRLIAVVFDDEFLADPASPLPRDRHDITVTDVVTPTGGYRHLSSGAAPDGKITDGHLALGGADGALSD